MARTVIKIKKDLIHKVKVKKSYAKLKAREPVEPSKYVAEESPEEPATQELHPERQKMLEDPEEPISTPQQKRSRRPEYFEKEKQIAEKRRAEAEARRLEIERNAREKKQKIEERERFRKAMAKARSGGKNGQRKLGRESKVLLEKVKRMVGE
jgi:hypothetical protein